MNKFFSNLNLNGNTSPRVQPGIGSWGPQGVPSTRSKKIWRVVWWALWILAMVGICVLGGWIFVQLRNATGG